MNRAAATPSVATMAARIAASPATEVAIESPLEAAPLISERTGQQVWLKREDSQPVFSFKLRGAYHRMQCLSSDERRRGVVAASAGNHAQGVALAAARLGIPAHIVMPSTTPHIKVDAVRRLGAEVVLHGDGFDDASAEATRRVASSGMAFIHPFDDPEVIAGQGTVGREIMRQAARPPDVVFVPVGGGGLIAGVAAAIRHQSPKTRIIAVEPVGAASFQAALKAGRPVDIGPVNLFADGVAVRRVGEHPFRLARELISETVTVSTDRICEATHDIFFETRTVVEPAGALAVAGALEYAERKAHDSARRPDQHWVAINSGANIGFDRMAHVTERAEFVRGREILFSARIPEQPGSFLAFCRTIGPIPITEFNYRYAGTESAEVFVGLRLDAGRDYRHDLFKRLARHGIPTHDLTDREIAHDHLRHMVGGRSQLPEHEQCYHFHFPERPGALLDFLTTLGARWSISLFHYRNHGAAHGKVLAGFLVPASERSIFERWLDRTGHMRAPIDDAAFGRFLGYDQRNGQQPPCAATPLHS